MKTKEILFITILSLLAAQPAALAKAGSTSESGSYGTSSSSTEETFDMYSSGPVSQMGKAEEEMDRFFEERKKRGSSSGSPAFFSPKLDFSEADTQYTLKLALPGMKKENIQIETNPGSITISGEQKTVKKENLDEKNFKTETSSGSFSRTISLPADVDQENIKADYEAEILTIILPRKTGAATPQTARPVSIE